MIRVTATVGRFGADIGILPAARSAWSPIVRQLVGRGKGRSGDERPRRGACRFSWPASPGGRRPSSPVARSVTPDERGTHVVASDPAGKERPAAPPVIPSASRDLVSFRTGATTGSRGGLGMTGGAG
jgi:hypothetical protein